MFVQEVDYNGQIVALVVGGQENGIHGILVGKDMVSASVGQVQARAFKALSSREWLVWELFAFHAYANSQCFSFSRDLPRPDFSD